LTSGKAKFWKTSLIIFLFLALVAAWLGYSDRGLVQLYRTDKERQAYVQRIHDLAEENQTLLQEIHRLRSDIKYVESVARRELHLIRPNEVIYRFKGEESLDDGPGAAPPEEKGLWEGKKSKREGRP